MGFEAWIKFVLSSDFDFQGLEGFPGKDESLWANLYIASVVSLQGENYQEIDEIKSLRQLSNLNPQKSNVDVLLTDCQYIDRQMPKISTSNLLTV